MNWRTIDVTITGNFWQTKIQRAILVRGKERGTVSIKFLDIIVCNSACVHVRLRDDQRLTKVKGETEVLVCGL